MTLPETLLTALLAASTGAGFVGADTIAAVQVDRAAIEKFFAGDASEEPPLVHPVHIVEVQAEPVTPHPVTDYDDCPPCGRG